MAKLGDVIKISDADYTALKNAGSTGYVINGVRYYYNENNIYLTPSNGGGGGTATDVQINGTSITSNNVANILTNSTYSSTNKIATMSDVPSVSLTTTTGSESITVGTTSLGVATRNTNQTIGGTKTFSSSPLLNNSIYINGKNTSGTSRNLIGINSSNQTVVGNSSQNTVMNLNSALLPNANGTKSLGSSSYKWQDIWLSGGLRSDSTTYKLQLPSMSSWTANRTIATMTDIDNIRDGLYHNSIIFKFRITSNGSTISDAGYASFSVDSYSNLNSIWSNYLADWGNNKTALFNFLTDFFNGVQMTCSGGFYSIYFNRQIPFYSILPNATDIYLGWFEATTSTLSSNSVRIQKSSSYAYIDEVNVTSVPLE